MQRYTIFFIIVNALHVSGGFSAHHQELKNRKHTASGMCQACLLCVQFLGSWWWGGKPAWNMKSIDSNKEYCITLNLVGYT